MYWTDWETHGVCQQFYGPVTGEERLAALTAMLDDRRLASARYIVIDFSGVVGVTMTYAEMETLASLMNGTLASVNPKVLLVYVIAGDEAQAHFQRVLDVAPLDHVRQVCSTLDDARAWLAEHAG